MASNFYNLPPPWNPGYAIPEATYDEGLRRQAFVTAMMPRGTYSAPKVGSGGYALPKYVKDEGYGQGTFTTSWLPRGYYGPDLPHYLDQTFSKIVGDQPTAGGNGVILDMETLGDAWGGGGAPVSYVAPDIYGTYGKRAAAAIITHVQRLPAPNRAAAMKSMMDKIDSSLYSRAGKYTSQLAKRGLPAKAAMANGVAIAMREGFVNELTKLGKTRAAPQSTSLLGLGMYEQALGAITLAQVAAKGAGLSSKATKQLRVGPFVLSLKSGQGNKVVYNGKGLTPAMATELQADLNKAFAREVAMDIAGANLTTYTGFRGATTTFKAEGLPSGWKASGGLGIPSGKVPKAPLWGSRPIAYFDHPETKDRQGLYIHTHPDGKLDMWWQRETTLAEAVGIALRFLVAVIEDVAEAVGDALKTIACSTVGAPGAAGAAAIAGGPAAAVGTGLAAGMCGNAPMPMPQPAPSTPILPILLIGGGALVLMAALKHKKKGKP